MAVEDIIFNKYSKYGYKSVSGELYLPFEWAVEIVKECNEIEVAVIGLEFFQLQDTQVVPVSPLNGMDCSDLLNKHRLWGDVVKGCNNFALKVLNQEQNRDSSQYCNFVLLDVNEWGNK